jgi:hypothetical protein
LWWFDDAVLLDDDTALSSGGVGAIDGGFDVDVVGRCQRIRTYSLDGGGSSKLLNRHRCSGVSPLCFRKVAITNIAIQKSATEFL